MRYLLILIFFSLPCALMAKQPVHMPATQQARSFIENKGQITDQFSKQRIDIDLRFDAGNGLNIFVGDGQLHYQWTKAEGQEAGGGGRQDNLSPLSAPRTSPSAAIAAYRMDATLIGANKNAVAEKLEQQSFFERYYAGWTGEEGVVAHSYQKIMYRDIYPHIDWVLYTTGSNLKYDFIIHPGGDPADIKLRYEGGTLALKDGALTATTLFGSITESAPYTYEAGTVQKIESNFKLNKDILSVNIGLAKEEIDQDIVIDPGVEWATYFLYETYPQEMDLDKQDNIYLVGHTINQNIATLGAFQTIFTGLNPGFITKFNTVGQLSWATYYPSPVSRIAIGGNDYIYISGETLEANGIATSGAHQGNLAGSKDIFLARFNTSGQRIWGTYHGGNANEDIDSSALATDAAGNVYCSGNTLSTNNIATPGTHQPVKIGDGYLVKFNAAGVKQWGTYLGCANFSTSAQAIATDDSGYIYLSGGTNCPDMGTPGTFRPNLSLTSISAAFFLKFSLQGQKIWGTYLSGKETVVSDILCMKNGDLVIGGYTKDSFNVAAGNTHQTYYGGAQDAFICRFSANGEKKWGTYFGGKKYEGIRGLCENATGSILCSGTSGSDSNIATSGAYKTVYQGGSGDGFITKLTSGGIQSWGSYFGGSNFDQCLLIKYGTNSNIFVLGGTQSDAGIATPGSFAPIYWGPGSYIVKFESEQEVGIASAFTDTLWCHNNSITIPYNVTRPFNSNNNFTLQLSDISGSFANTVTLATVSGTGGGIFHATVPANITAGKGYRLRITASNPAYVSNDNDIDIRISAFPGISAVSNSPVCSGDSLQLIASSIVDATITWTGPAGFSSTYGYNKITNVTAAQQGSYIATATRYGCSSIDTVTVTVKPKPATPVAGSNSPVTEGEALHLNATSATAGVGYHWFGPNGFSSELQNPARDPSTTADSGDYKVYVTLDGCHSDTATTLAVVNSKTILPGDTNKYEEIRLYPNPNDGNFTLWFPQSYRDKTIKLTIFDAMGRETYETTVSPASGMVDIGPGNMPAGFYTLRITYDKRKRWINFSIK